MFSQVAFLSAIVGSDVASAAAQAAISAQSRVDLNDGEIETSINSIKQEGISPSLHI
jgi:SWI/SNF related-matrix-associated actin-dependent regulator of chromatin subfamily C